MNEVLSQQRQFMELGLPPPHMRALVLYPTFIQNQKTRLDCLNTMLNQSTLTFLIMGKFPLGQKAPNIRIVLNVG